MPSRQHLRRVKQNKVAPPRKRSKLYAATPRSNSISRRRSSRFTTWNAHWANVDDIEPFETYNGYYSLRIFDVLFD